MAHARGKIVKVENIHAGVSFAGEDTIIGHRDDNKHKTSPDPHESAVTKLNAKFPVVDLQVISENDVDDDDFPSEAGDQLCALPAGWPKIPQLTERHSWNFSTTVSPSVNKAVGHLELLQNIIEEWFKETGSSGGSRASSRTMSTIPNNRKSEPRKQLRFNESRTQSVLSNASATKLSIQGMGALTEQDKQSSKKHGLEYEIPHLGADEVIEEVVVLLAKLEDDRQETLKNLRKERERVGILGAKIDALATNRMMDLPKLVQKEHEACAMDISELNWHVNHNAKNEALLMNRVSVADALNQKLKEDVAFVHGHIPLVAEKLELEQEAMSKIQEAQNETSEELGITMDRCQKVDQKSVDAHVKAEQERTSMKNDLDGVRDDLSKINTDLSEAKTLYTTYVEESDNCREKLQSNEEELKLLAVKEENTKVAEALQAAKLKEFQTSIVKAEYEHRRLEDYNYYVQTDKETKYANNCQLEEDLEAAIAHKSEILRQLLRQNQEAEMDIDDSENKIKNYDKQKLSDQKNLDRMVKELDRTQRLISVTMDDLSQLLIINSATRDQLKNVEDKCVSTEEALRSTYEQLKKQIKDEMHTSTVLNARINSDATESEKVEEETKEKTTKAQKKVAEVEAAVKTITAKVEKLQQGASERKQKFSVLEDQYQTLSEEKASMTESCNKTISEKAPIHENLKSEVQNLDKKLDHIKKKTELMVNRMEEMSASGNMIQKTYNKTEKAIENLHVTFDELNIQIEEGKRLLHQTQLAYNEVVNRDRDREREHKELMRERKAVYQKQKYDLEENMTKNGLLAAKYRSLQNQYLIVKNKGLNKDDNKVITENEIKDLRQLQSLQQKMHAALLEYFKFRGLYNQSELARMDKDSNVNGVRVGKLQSRMDISLDKIATFLQEQLDGDTIRREAMEKVEREAQSNAVF